MINIRNFLRKFTFFAKNLVMEIDEIIKKFHRTYNFKRFSKNRILLVICYFYIKIFCICKKSIKY